MHTVLGSEMRCSLEGKGKSEWAPREGGAVQRRAFFMTAARWSKRMLSKKDAYSSCREPGLCTSVTPIPRDLMPSFDLCRLFHTQGAHTYIQDHTHAHSNTGGEGKAWWQCDWLERWIPWVQSPPYGTNEMRSRSISNKQGRRKNRVQGDVK